jgi:hypothetical protein
MKIWAADLFNAKGRSRASLSHKPWHLNKRGLENFILNTPSVQPLRTQRMLYTSRKRFLR